MVNLAELKRIRQAAARIRYEIKRAENIATRTTSIPNGMPHGKQKHSKVEDGAVLLTILKEQYAETLKQIEQMKTELEEMFCTIEDPDRRATMRLVFLYGHNPEQVADACGLCPRTVYHYMKSGKEELSSRFPDRFQV